MNVIVDYVMNQYHIFDYHQCMMITNLIAQCKLNYIFRIKNQNIVFGNCIKKKVLLKEQLKSGKLGADRVKFIHCIVGRNGSFCGILIAKIHSGLVEVQSHFISSPFESV